jgi:nickel-dependent lactate racemase
MHRLSDGLFSESLRVTINKRILDYDHLLLVSPVVPHEAAGFSGGNKYFFPGIGGVDIIQTFHWIAALITNPVINGMMETPVRRIIDRGASHVPVPSLAFCFVVGEEGIVGLYAGPPGEAWRPAARCSSHWHIRHTDRAFRRVIGVTPSIYEELWVGGKAMYKLEPVVEDGGELIIYGPQIREISFVHGKRILSVGYHVRDYFTAQWDRFSAVPKLILAHSTNVRGIGAFRAGREEPRITVTLATGIPEEVCRRVNLGYRDPRSLDPAAEARNPDTLVVPNAGQELYRLRHSTSITS